MLFTPYHKELIDKLQELCPTTFPRKPFPKVPLAYNSVKAVQRVLNVNYVTADFLLQHWCSTPDAPRYFVDGTVHGKVSSSESQWHKGKLEEYYRSRAVGQAKYHQGSLVDYYESKFHSQPTGVIRWLRNKLGGVQWN